MTILVSTVGFADVDLGLGLSFCEYLVHLSQTSFVSTAGIAIAEQPTTGLWLAVVAAPRGHAALEGGAWKAEVHAKAFATIHEILHRFRDARGRFPIRIIVWMRKMSSMCGYGMTSNNHRCHFALAAPLLSRIRLAQPLQRDPEGLCGYLSKVQSVRETWYGAAGRLGR